MLFLGLLFAMISFLCGVGAGFVSGNMYARPDLFPDYIFPVALAATVVSGVIGLTILVRKK